MLARSMVQLVGPGMATDIGSSLVRPKEFFFVLDLCMNNNNDKLVEYLHKKKKT